MYPPMLALACDDPIEESSDSARRMMVPSGPMTVSPVETPESIVNFMRYPKSTVFITSNSAHVKFFRFSNANTVITMTTRTKIPMTWACCKPAALMAACSKRASLLDICRRFRRMAINIPSPNTPRIASKIWSEVFHPSLNWRSSPVFWHFRSHDCLLSQVVLHRGAWV